MKNPQGGPFPEEQGGPGLSQCVENVLACCTSCKICQGECAFLRKHGKPREIAKKLAAAPDPQTLAIAYECSLCGLCTAVCSYGCDPAALFFAMRRQAHAESGDLPAHKGLLAYEKRGASRRFSWYALPGGCSTVFFPGCTLPGTRPETTRKLFLHLARSVPSLGIVMDCCCKPSHDLGRTEYFQVMFSELRGYLLENGVRKVLCACPNCFKVFSAYGQGLEAEMVYTVLEREGLPESGAVSGSVVVHDPCPLRKEAGVHQAVRSLLSRKGLEVEAMEHEGPQTLCCGEGGAVAGTAPDLARSWARKRAGEAGQRPMLTYCAGCAGFLKPQAPAHHVLDFVWAPEQTLSGKARVAFSPFTYWNRLRLKKWFQQHVPAPRTRERTFTPPGMEKSKRRGWAKIAVLLVLAMLIAYARASGLTQYVEEERLRGLVAGTGPWAPAVFMLIYALAPSLLLPGLPITVAGGVLFGPFWGVVYSMAGATAGACLAFLVSRYIARDWVSAKLSGPRWQSLDQAVETRGWKVVAFTRLVPLFPFNLLNYAFGLTRVRFWHYALASFVFMLPGCIAYVVFSSSLLDVLRGRISREFLIGAALIACVSLLPLIIRRVRAKRGMGDL